LTTKNTKDTNFREVTEISAVAFVLFVFFVVQKSLGPRLRGEERIVPLI
jgi:hypothetical protein